MGLKGYRLWVMGQLDSNVQRPTSWHSSMHGSLNVAMCSGTGCICEKRKGFETSFSLHRLEG
jgi:hypothetical protein